MDDRRPKPLKDAGQGDPIEQEKLSATALQMRAEGMSYRAIALAMQVGVATAHQYVNRGWQNMVEDNDQVRSVLREVEVERLEELINAVWKVAVGDVADLGDEAQAVAIENQLKAQGTIIRSVQTIARLRGLFAPAKIEHSRKSDLVPLDQLVALVAASKNRRAARPALLSSRS